MRILGKLVILCLSLTATSSELRAGDPWRITRFTGTAVIINTDRTVRPVELNGIIEPGQTIATSSSGRVMLVKGATTIMVAPSSAMVITPNRSDDGKIVVLQRKGQLDVEVEKRESRYFSVETPFLAAVVKGTHFSVSVGRSEARVNVTEGLVRVDGFIAGKTALVGAGLSVTAKKNGAFGISGPGKSPAIGTIPMGASLVASSLTSSTKSNPSAVSRNSGNGGNNGTGNGGGGSNSGGGNSGGGDGGGSNSGGGDGGGHGGGHGGGDGGGNGGGHGGGNGDGH
jgi:FecR protein